MLVAVLLAVAHLSPPLSARPLYNAEDSKRDTNIATEEINHAQDVLNTKTGNLEMKEQKTIKLDESDQGVVGDGVDPVRWVHLESTVESQVKGKHHEITLIIGP